VVVLEVVETLVVAVELEVYFMFLLTVFLKVQALQLLLELVERVYKMQV
jgi:hypothetical protein